MKTHSGIPRVLYGIGIYADIHNSLSLSARVATTYHGYFHLESNQIKPIWDIAEYPHVYRLL